MWSMISQLMSGFIVGNSFKRLRKSKQNCCATWKLSGVDKWRWVPWWRKKVKNFIFDWMSINQLTENVSYVRSQYERLSMPFYLLFHHNFNGIFSKSHSLWFIVVFFLFHSIQSGKLLILKTKAKISLKSQPPNGIYIPSTESDNN